MSLWGEHPIVPLASFNTSTEVDAASEGLLAGGLPIIEIALRTDYGFEALRRMVLRTELTVGAGTVLTVEQAKMVVDAGAAFAVTPGLSPKIVEFFMNAGVPVLPGVLTPSEVQNALALGLDHLKLFPANAVDGFAMLDACRAVYPRVRFMPSGGVSPSNAMEYLSRSNVFSVSGSWLLKGAERGAEVIRREVADAMGKLT
ncbi:bifunctional 4-hydroxy-2-oxoglutarate aldolase/2-dehydro-3-deoxy-phosphogluconate aldolase [Nesterenkonia sp. Act20]|uniref:bifunctional 4-hydroxy-2-oxoglutarate aldolase/2-dehydro-3-deoxy-phosphogluconate aldolase n=1 Tax=Nesterenkonia sp. Act20 TaxID=1483432 RepID=UPI001C47D27E|nr:bifunctional 4-hydroxy-2-oxoglutarate aldolase/2-dehydro-3-deoxy-phosphogluconate aldolase [Nesterenkonia sp. Act20]